MSSEVALFGESAPSGFHNQLGNLYDAVGQSEQAREHYAKAAQYKEQSGDRHSAGATRFNMAVMYLQAASPRKPKPNN